MDKSKLNIVIKKPLESLNYECVEFIGDLDKFGLQTIKDGIEEIVNGLGCDYLVFDFSKLNFLNSESIGFLLTVHYRLTKKNKNLVLVSAPANVKDVLDVIGMLKLIKYFDSVFSFEESLKK